jgi:DNA-binding MarR family transcriptional regulator/ribosomal protein S18 acetylase RimI-like enzyme
MVDDIVRNFGFLTLGTRLKRIGEALQSDTQRIVNAFGLKVQPSQYPLLAAIDREGPLTIGELSAAIGISQPGVTRAAGLLAGQGLVRIGPSPNDQRQRIATLTDEGRSLVEFSKRNVWPRIEAAVRDLCSGLSGPLLDQLTRIEQGLVAAPLSSRVDMNALNEIAAHPLDRPFWSALTSSQARLSLGGALARRYAPGLIPFVASGKDDPESLEAMVSLMEGGETLYVVQHDTVPDILGTERIASARVVQMLCEQPIEPADAQGIQRLNESDADEMLVLATLTKPGPFCRRAGELGEFWGVKIDGRLAGMAGTRMVLPGYTELSGVCTHPDFQGHGLGRRLSVFVARRFIEQGGVPFLHAFDTNLRAIGLYESIGFRIRTTLNVAIVRRV